MILFYLSLAAAVRFVPLVGTPASFILLSWVYAFYSFECGAAFAATFTKKASNLVLVRYIWINRGWTLAQRVGFFETHWAYFFGFGTQRHSASPVVNSAVQFRSAMHAFDIFLVAPCQRRRLCDDFPSRAPITICMFGSFTDTVSSLLLWQTQRPCVPWRSRTRSCPRGSSTRSCRRACPSLACRGGRRAFLCGAFRPFGRRPLRGNERACTRIELYHHIGHRFSGVMQSCPP